MVLRSYWYCKNQTFDIVIEIDIAYLKNMVLIPILILQDKLNYSTIDIGIDVANPLLLLLILILVLQPWVIKY